MLKTQQFITSISLIRRRCHHPVSLTVSNCRCYFALIFFFISIDCAKSIDSKHDSEVFYHVFNFMTAIDRWRWSALSYFNFGIPPSPSSIFLRRCERCFGICCFINRVKLYWLLPELRYQKAFPTHESFIIFFVCNNCDFWALRFINEQRQLQKISSIEYFLKVIWRRIHCVCRSLS